MKLQPNSKRNTLENSEKLIKLSPFFPLNFLEKAAELYNDIYKQKKYTLCSKNIENKKLDMCTVFLEMAFKSELNYHISLPITPSASIECLTSLDVT